MMTIRILGWVALLVLLAPRIVAAASPDDPPLTVESFICRGNESTSCAFILSHLYLAAGDPIDEHEIREATIRLQWRRNFDSVAIYLEKGSQRGRANVVVEVHEARPITYEAALGFYSQASSVGQFVYARATHYNLFGDGKILDLRASTLTPIDGPLARGESATLQYIDPHINGSKRNFAAAGLWYENRRREWDNDDLVDAEQIGLDLSYGRRLWSFSYVTAGYRFRPMSDVYIRRRTRPNGFFNIRTDTNHGGALLGFGWTSEEDPYFPTQGSRLHVGMVHAFDGRDAWSLSYRKNWRFGEDPGVWTFITELHDQISVQYARPLASAERFGLRRGRWYAAPFLRPYYNKPDGGMVREFGLSAGVQLETKTFGIVHLYILGSAISVAGDN